MLSPGPKEYIANFYKRSQSIVSFSLWPVDRLKKTKMYCASFVRNIKPNKLRLSFVYTPRTSLKEPSGDGLTPLQRDMLSVLVRKRLLLLFQVD